MKPVDFALVLPLLLMGCGPSVHSLVQAKHYREAVCAAHDGSSDEQDEVARALDRDADILVHVHPVSASELQPVLGLDMPAALDRGRILRVSLQSNILPLDALELEAKLTTTDGKMAGLPADWNALAWFTNEKLPAKHLAQTYLTTDNFWKGTAVLLTVGLSLLFTRFQPMTYEADAPLWEFKEKAPRAYALHETTQLGGCKEHDTTSGAGKKCTFYFIADSVSTEPILLQIDARYVSKRQTGKSSKDAEDRCVVPRSARLPLGTPQEIEKVTHERFGDQMQPVRSLIRTK